MNCVDELLQRPFSQLSQEEKIEVKRLGPHQPSDFKLVQQDKKQKRNFQNSWFKKCEWLTVSFEKQSLFCFYCLLFCESSTDCTWSKLGFKDLKHLSEKITKHEKSTSHMNCAIRYKTLGQTNILAELDSGYRSSIKRHNEEVDKNRHILNRIIECVKFCGFHQVPLRGHDEREASTNRGVFLDLVTLLSKLDSQLQDHLENATVAKHTSGTIQNEILDCMYEIYLEHLKEELETVSFVAVEADETTDISCRSQFVITLRFLRNCEPVERFLKFVEITDRTASGLYSVLKKELNDLGLKEKLIAQVYDGASVMRGSSHSVQSLLKQDFPNAHYVHCYAHQANLMLKKLTTHISKVRVFFQTLSGFSTFFASSPKRADALREVTRKKLPRTCETRWNFQTRIISSVYENKDDIIDCFTNIENSEGWDDTTVQTCFGLRNFLQNPSFNYLLEFFNKVFYSVDILFNVFQTRTTNGLDASNAISDFNHSIFELRNSLPDSQPEQKRRRTESENVSMSAIAKEVCDILTTQLADRFYNTLFTSAFSIVDPKQFDNYRYAPPSEHITTLGMKYPFLDTNKLRSELDVIYSNQTFTDGSIPTVRLFYKKIVELDLTRTFTEVTKVLKILLTTPIASAEPERCFSVLKRIKTYLRNSMGQERLNCLTVLSVHRDELQNISNFNDKVMNKFAALKDRRANFLYK